MKFPFQRSPEYKFQGEIYMLWSDLLSGLFPIFSLLAIAATSPLYTAGFSTLIAAVFFAIVMTIRKEWKELRIRKAWKDIFLASFIIGVIFYALFFIGLSQTTAGNASIISLMQVFFCMAILRLWGKERLKRKHVYGSVLMVVGALLVLFQGNIQINEGDMIILLAATIPPVGNYFAREARNKVSSTTIMFIRSVLAGIFLMILAFTFEPFPSRAGLEEAAMFLLVNGFLLFGFTKILWLEAIHRISITKATALTSLTPAFTLLFAYFILQEIPTIWQILGFLPMAIGILLLTEYKFRNGHHHHLFS